MAKTNKTRLYILIGLTIASAIFLVLAIIPNSPLVGNNICMDTEKAAKMYASTDLKAKTKYIEKRNNQCKDLLRYAQKPKDTFEQLDNCNMLDSVIDASNHYVELHKNNSKLANEELRYLKFHIKNYKYCPQYEEVVKGLNKKANK